jgi:hypothetical protein
VGELRDAGVSAVGVAWGVQAVLDLVIGSVLLDRQLERQPAQRDHAEELWSLDDAYDDPELLEVLSRPSDESQLFEQTLTVVVRSVLEGSFVRRDTGARRGARSG